MSITGKVFLLTALVTLALFTQCTKPTIIGSDLIDSTGFPFEKHDTISMSFFSSPLDSFVAYAPGVSAQVGPYPLGYVNDPFFGTSKTWFYMQFVGSYGLNEPDFPGSQFDSLVLSVGADTAFIYGKPDPTAAIAVHRVLEQFPDTTIYSYTQTPVGPTPIGRYTDPVWPIPYLSAIEPRADGATPDTLVQHRFRIRLDDAIGLELMGLDSTTLVDDSLFIKAFPGVALTFEDPFQAYLGLLFNTGSTSLSLYFTKDGKQRVARWIPVSLPSTPRVCYVYHEFDRTTATYPLLLTQNKTTDSVHFVQGLSGHETVIQFPWVDQMERVLVNHAELEIHVCPLDLEDPKEFGMVPQMEVFTFDANGEFVFIDDLTFSLKSGNTGLNNYFGGRPIDTGGGQYVYRINLSAHLQKMIEKRSSPLIYLRSRARAGTPGRTVLCGPEGSKPPKLTVTYTRLN